jgi:hypothetical protein
MARRKWNIETIKQVVNGENPIIQSGYTPKTKRHKIGDIWTDIKGITWAQRKGYKVRVNKQADCIRELVRKICSVCKKDLDISGDRVDNKIFSKTGKCFACLEVEEMQLKLEGKYKDYEDKKILSNKLSVLKEMKKYVEESIEYLKKKDSKIQMVCSNGDIVNWEGEDLDGLLKTAEEDLIKIKKEIETISIEK